MFYLFGVYSPMSVTRFCVACLQNEVVFCMHLRYLIWYYICWIVMKIFISQFLVDCSDSVNEYGLGI
jgi:hypothetical protein